MEAKLKAYHHEEEDDAKEVDLQQEIRKIKFEETVELTLRTNRYTNEKRKRNKTQVISQT